MQKSSKNNKYKYNVGDVAYVIYDDKYVLEVTVKTRFLRPYRLSDNFYLCTWVINNKYCTGVKYEKSMYKTWESAITALESGNYDREN